MTFFNREIFDLDWLQKVRFAFLANFVLKAWQDALPMYFWSKNHNCLLKWIGIHRISGWFCAGGKSNQVYRYLTPTQNIDLVKGGASTYDDGAVLVWDIQTACRIGWQEFLWIDFIFQILFCCFFICCLNISCDRLKNKYHSAGLLTLKILPVEVKHLFRDMWRLYRPRVIENMLESKVFPTFSYIRPHLRTIVSIEILLCH